MRIGPFAAVVAALLIGPTEAVAGDPVMPLGDVRAGMRCTGYSVVRGTDVSAFAVEVVDVVDDRSTGSGPRILVEVSGPAVDETGVGPGFSGSPIYCRDAQGTARNIGAISESIGEYGGKVALATPIEAILATAVDPPRAAPGPTGERRVSAARAAPSVVGVPPGARPLLAPLTISGLAPALGNALQAAAARRGRVLLAAPAGPLGSFPAQQLRPGSAFAVGYASGDLAASAVGTVSYTDGDRVWGFGHLLDGVGARALLLKDAYVFRVVSNPVVIPGVSGTYKYAAAGHDVGTLTNDAPNAVAGRVGALPPTVPVRVLATDLDTGAQRSLVTNVADESAVDQPYGSSILSLLAPLAVLQAGDVLGGSPARLTGRGCFAIAFGELAQPARFCNRYVANAPDPLAGNAVAASAGADMLAALALVDAYKGGPLRVTGIEASVEIRRGRRQAYLRAVQLPRRARAGRRVPATLTLRHVGGRLERRRVMLRLPGGLRPGRQRVVFTGTDIDLDPGLTAELVELDFEELGGSGGSFGATSPRALAARIERLARFDGLRARRPGRGSDDVEAGVRSYLDPNLRISGRARASIRITRR